MKQFGEKMHNEEELKKKLTKIFFHYPDSWKFCTVKVSELSEVYKKIIVDKLGNHPYGDYVILDDCACHLDGGAGDYVLHPDGGRYYKNPKSQADMCKCECHKSIAELVEMIVDNLGINIMARENWRKEKPGIPCLFATRKKMQNGKYHYNFFRLTEFQDAETYYLSWCDLDGEEYGDYDDIEADEYCILLEGEDFST